MIAIISNHLLVHETRSFSVPLQAQQLSSYKLMWWKRAEERAGRFFIFFFDCGEKSCCDYGKSSKSRIPHYSRTNTHGVVSSPALPSLSMEDTRSHTFVPLPQSLSEPFSVVGEKTTNPIKVIGTRDTNNSIRAPPCNYLQHLLDTHRQSAVGLFHGSSRDTKTYYQSNFPLSPRAKQSV